jgi:hypothetical protein
MEPWTSRCRQQRQRLLFLRMLDSHFREGCVQWNVKSGFLFKQGEQWRGVGFHGGASEL